MFLLPYMYMALGIMDKPTMHDLQLYTLRIYSYSCYSSIKFFNYIISRFTINVNKYVTNRGFVVWNGRSFNQHNSFFAIEKILSDSDLLIMFVPIKERLSITGNL